jgi:hypothetical protein
MAKPVEFALYPTPVAPNPTITANGSTGHLDLGSRGVNGRIVLYDASGDNSIYIESSGKRILLRNGKYESMQLDATKALLLLRYEKDKNSIVLDGTKNYVGIKDKNGNDSVAIDGRYGNIILRDFEGRQSIVLDQGNHRMVFPDASGFWGITLYGDQKKLIVQNDSGKDTIELDGNTGDIVLANADCAEDFEILESAIIEPGTVMVIEEEGKLRQSMKSYDKRVAGIISGAGDCKPGIVLDKKQSCGSRRPIALMGKVFCKVEGDTFPVEAGDLLTTSDVPGHAMKAADPMRTFGAVIGKALRSLKAGKSLIPILIALQ